ncbi:unnamed protein product, partial [Ilex paraguariensis]
MERGQDGEMVETGRPTPMGGASTVLGAMGNVSPSLGGSMGNASALLSGAMGDASSPLGGALSTGDLHVASAIGRVLGGGSNMACKAGNLVGGAHGAGLVNGAHVVVKANGAQSAEVGGAQGAM